MKFIYIWVIENNIYSKYSNYILDKDLVITHKNINLKLKPIFNHKKYIYDSEIIFCLPSLINKNVSNDYDNFKIIEPWINNLEDFKTNYQLTKQLSVNFKIELILNKNVNIKKITKLLDYFDDIINISRTENNTHIYISYHNPLFLCYYYYFIRHYLEFNNIILDNSNSYISHIKDLFFTKSNKMNLHISFTNLNDNINILENEYNLMDSKINTMNIFYKSYINKINLKNINESNISDTNINYLDTRAYLYTNIFSLINYHLNVLYEYYLDIYFNKYEILINDFLKLMINEKLYDDNMNIINILNSNDDSKTKLLKIRFYYYYIQLLNNSIKETDNKISLQKSNKENIITNYNKLLYIYECYKDNINILNLLMGELNYENNIYLLISEIIILLSSLKNDNYDTILNFCYDYLKYNKYYYISNSKNYIDFKNKIQNIDCKFFYTLFKKINKIINYNIDDLESKHNFTNKFTKTLEVLNLDIKTFYYYNHIKDIYKYNSYISSFNVDFKYLIDYLLSI